LIRQEGKLEGKDNGGVTAMGGVVRIGGSMESKLNDQVANLGWKG